MTREEFRRLCEKKVVLLDGATGTNLQAAGMGAGVCPEKWILEHPDILADLQRKYYEAGSDIVLAPTFTANRVKLAEYGLEQDIKDINERLLAISRGVRDQVQKEQPHRKLFVAGDMTMTGQGLVPTGTMEFEDLVDVYKQQAGILADAGADLFIVETMISLNECRAALIAIRETCDLPVMISLSFNEDGRTFYGSDPETVITVLQSLGADAVGLNCSTGPEQMVDLVKQMKRLANIPVIAKPNAGMPMLQDGTPVYGMDAEDFARAMLQLLDAGAGIIGGCCGTGPQYIRKIAALAADRPAPSIDSTRRRLLASERRTLEIPLDGPFLVVGERINPTGKKKLKEAIKNKDMDAIIDLALEQEEKGACVLDINMGMNGIDEKEMMLKTVQEVSMAVNLPLCIDSSHVDVIEAALRIYPGRALINSISLEEKKIKGLLPVAAKYGAMFILLPLSDEGIPETVQKRKEIIDQVCALAKQQGMHMEDIIVDGLLGTVGAGPRAGLDTLDTISYCHDEKGLATICGLSNISFGLPQRVYVNTAFLTLAIARGLTMAIANPSQDLLMNAKFATDLLLAKEGSAEAYIDHMEQDGGSSPAPAKAAPALDWKEQIYQDVLKGSSERIVEDVKNGLAAGAEPDQIIQTILIPAIQKVGDLFEQKKYFLPQLISSAQAMEAGIHHLEPLLASGDKKEKGTVVIATVEGDIHDIGKNLVALMLRNYGYRVIDLGKDVPAEVIVETAMREQAQVIGLSALMTTTMLRMKDVIAKVRELGCKSRVIIGGAVITQSYADEIGADGYSKDAAQAVELVDRLIL